jgi:hypothetical protein
VLGEALLADAVEGGELAEAGGAGVVGLAAGGDALGDDQEIFRRVFGRDEFEDFGFVAGPFEELGAEGIGDELGLAFLEDTVAEGVGEDVGRGELSANFLLAAGRDDEEAGAGGDALGEGVVGGGVAGVEGDEDVEGIFEFRVLIFDCRRADLAGGEGEILEGGFLRDAVAEGDEFGAGFDAGDLGAVAEEGGDGEGEVAFAAAGVQDAEGSRGRVES